MQTIESLTIRITYEVRLRQVDMPKEVYQQLQEAYSIGDSIKHNKEQYSKAHEWIYINISEIDNCQYKAEVQEITE